MEDGTNVPDPIDLNNINGLILFATGISLTPDTDYQFAQLTLSNTSNGTIEVKYASPANPDIYQTHVLNVTNGAITKV